MHAVKAKAILSARNGMNTYRGCSHGCIYCDSRSLCYGFDHEFEDIEVKENAPELLEKALKSKRKRCMIGTGSMCDPYMHIEEKLCLTRKCLEIIDRYEFGATVLTKSSRVLRDIGLLESINEKAKAVLQMTMTTFDEKLCRVIEPGASTTKERYETLLKFRDSGIPTIVWLSPVLPFINDTEENLRGILDYCADAGVKGIICFNMGMTLREGNREYYYESLDRHFPGLKEKYIRTYGDAYAVPSPRNGRLMELFRETCDKYGIMSSVDECFSYLNDLPEKYVQETLF